MVCEELIIVLGSRSNNAYNLNFYCQHRNTLIYNALLKINKKKIDTQIF